MVDSVGEQSATGGLTVDPALAAFVADELLAGLDLTPEWFWSTVADLHARFAPRVTELLARRDELQERLDAWHREHGAPGEDELDDYVAFLTEIGYLLRPEEPRIAVSGVDREIAEVPGPQLVVPATVPRYALNAANARWGSLFDALYGTDALPTDHELARGYDERRGAQVIAEADRLLDAYFPLDGASHADVTAYRVADGSVVAVTGSGTAGLADPAQFAGYRGDPDAPEAVLLRRHGLHAELTVDAEHQVGRQHHAHVADLLLESAVTTIVDLEDSVATVDGPDKVGAYRTWLGLMTGELTATFPKGGKDVTRSVHGDRTYTAPDGSELVLPGRALLLVRNVGHHMRLDAVDGGRRAAARGGPRPRRLDGGGAATTCAGWAGTRTPGPAASTSSSPRCTARTRSRCRSSSSPRSSRPSGCRRARSRSGSWTRSGGRRSTWRRASRAPRSGSIFVNTGFLDRTGDEIHTVFEAGPVIRKDDEKSSVWLQAYEDRNVDVALRAGFAGQRPDRQGHVGPAGRDARDARHQGRAAEGGREHRLGALADGGDPARAALPGDGRARRAGRAGGAAADRPAQAAGGAGAAAAGRGAVRRAEAATSWRRTPSRSSATSCAGSGSGIGCSTVPDLDGVGLMEDRATLRISSQEIANWLHHGLVDEATVRETFARMAVLVDEQNAREPGYQPMSKDLEHSPSFQAALELVFAGRQEPNGYTERALTHWRQRAKAGGGTAPAGTAPARPCSTTRRRTRRAEGGRRTGGCSSCAPPATTTPTRRASSLPFSGSTSSDTAARTPPRSTRRSSLRRAGTSRSATWAGDPVACGGWRVARTAGPTAAPARDGDAEVKRMFVHAAHRGRGHARAVLAELERTAAAAGRRRAVLETGTRQPEAIALYTSAGLRARRRGSGCTETRRTAGASRRSWRRYG